MYTVFEDIISIRKGQHREGSTATKRYVCMYERMCLCSCSCLSCRCHLPVHPKSIIVWLVVVWYWLELDFSFQWVNILSLHCTLLLSQSGQVRSGRSVCFIERRDRCWGRKGIAKELTEDITVCVCMYESILTIGRWRLCRLGCEYILGWNLFSSIFLFPLLMKVLYRIIRYGDTLVASHMHNKFARRDVLSSRGILAEFAVSTVSAAARP